MIFSNKQYDIAIIGAGVVGCAIARELSKYKLKVVLIEKEADVAEGTSKSNSGVIHAGFNVKTGSLKAKFNVLGLTELPKLADELGLECRICKKLVVAKDDEEKQTLIKLYEQGEKNNVPGLSIIAEKTIHQIEPKINAKWALYSEKTGIITPFLLTIALAENSFRNGVDVILNSEVTSVKKIENTYCVGINNSEVICSDWVINSAGLFSDSVAELAGEEKIKIFPCRGEYFILDKMSKNDLNIAVYPVPCKDNRGLGIHLTPTLNGNVLIGPSAEYLEPKDDFSTTYDVMEQLKKEAFELMPSLQKYDFIRSFSGIRPKLFNENSKEKFADFYIKESEINPKFINLHGIESPGLTSAPVIAKFVVENIISQKMDLEKKDEFYPEWESILRFDEVSYKEKKRLVENNKFYSEIICRCEGVTKAEIIKAINNPLNVCTLEGIKKRTHSMMGRCQSGFCMSRIIELLINEKKISPEDILMKGKGSNIIFSGRK